MQRGRTCAEHCPVIIINMYDLYHIINFHKSSGSLIACTLQSIQVSKVNFQERLCCRDVYVGELFSICNSGFMFIGQKKFSNFNPGIFVVGGSSAGTIEEDVDI